MAFDFCPGPHPSCMLSALVCDRVQCLRKASMGPSAVENAIRPTTMPIALKKFLSCVEEVVNKVATRAPTRVTR